MGPRTGGLAAQVRHEPRRGVEPLEPARGDDLVALSVLAAALAAVVLFPTLDRDLQFGMGPDVPVYLWWGRAAAELGLDAVPSRPGTAALLPALGGTLGAGEVATQAGLQYALVVVLGLASGGLAAAGGARRSTWALAGALGGLFATFLAAGYLSSLTMTALFLAALAALAKSRVPAVPIALLAAAGLAHPQFLLVGIVVLALAGSWARLAGRREEGGRALRALVGGGLLVAAGLVLARLGGPAVASDTSKDALLRRVGLESTLHRLYVDRFARSWDRYAPWALVPLALAGVAERPRDTAGRAADAAGPVRRLLAAWLAVTALAVAVALATGWFPADRVVTFAYCLPILAASGAARLASLGRFRPLPAVLAAVLVVAIAWPALEAWNEKRVFVKRPQLAKLTAAGRVAATTQPRTELVFIVRDEDEPELFHLTFAGNLARTAVPAARIADVRVHRGPIDEVDPDAAVFLLPALAPDEPPGTLHRWSDNLLSSVPGPRPLPVRPGEVRPSSAGAIAWTTIGVVSLLTLVGHGWARAALGSTVTGWAVSPAFGLGATILAAFAVDRMGIGLDGRLGPILASALAGAGGYALADRRGRRHR